MSDKPREIREHQFHVDQTFDFEDERAHRLRMLMSVDALVADVWATIDGFDERESTWGVYASDNGLLWGEHWLRRKFFAYDESIRVPFRFAVPDRGPAKFSNALVANIDVAPTLLDIAGGAQRSSFDGRTLVRLVRGERRASCFCRRTVLIENREFVKYSGLRLPRWKYVFWPSGNQELYHLKNDPYELQNLARLPRYREQLANLRAKLDELATS